MLLTNSTSAITSWLFYSGSDKNIGLTAENSRNAPLKHRNVEEMAEFSFTCAAYLSMQLRTPYFAHYFQWIQANQPWQAGMGESHAW